jgi:ketosteroid isomerase-like protein
MDSKETKELAEQNIALVHKFIDATNAWDFSALRELFDPEVTIELPWTVDPFPKAVRGIENVMKFMESVPDFALAENLYDFDIHVFADDPNELFMEFKSDMTLKSGREYKNDYLGRVTVKDGKILVFREWPDPLRLLASLGGTINPPTDNPDIHRPD